MTTFINEHYNFNDLKQICPLLLWRAYGMASDGRGWLDQIL